MTNVNLVIALNDIAQSLFGTIDLLKGNDTFSNYLSLVKLVLYLSIIFFFILQDYFKKLSAVKYKKIRTSNDECAICIGTSKGEMVLTRCKHKFHKECIRRWEIRKDNCPCCRRTL
jgi:hypothetical protein